MKNSTFKKIVKQSVHKNAFLRNYDNAKGKQPTYSEFGMAEYL